MTEFIKNRSLKKHNTFGINAKAKYFTSFKSTIELKKIISSQIYKNNKSFILGDGSNILLTKDFNGLIMHNQIKSINIVEDNQTSIIVEVGGGMNWHTFVEWSVKKNLSGIENLALIPGTVGASPVQNIGAYGMEVKDTISKVYVFMIKERKVKIFSNNDCKFEYRDSIFKRSLKNRVIITKVEFRLLKKALNKTNYGAIENELKHLNLKPSPKNIAKAVINIRNRKLPNPSELGNSGSFFKNPVISVTKFKSLKKDFPYIIGYRVSEKKIKIAAGWLIENAGFKGYRNGDAGVHKNQALVLVNYKKASGQDIMNLARHIQKTILERYDIQIEPEVNIL